MQSFAPVTAAQIFYMLAVYNISQFHWNFHTLRLYFLMQNGLNHKGYLYFQLLLQHERSRISPSFAKLSTTWTNLVWTIFYRKSWLFPMIMQICSRVQLLFKDFVLLTSEKDMFCEPPRFTRHANNSKEVWSNEVHGILNIRYLLSVK